MRFLIRFKSREREKRRRGRKGKKKKRKRAELPIYHVKTQGEGGCLHSGRELPPDPDHAAARMSSLWDCERISV